MKKTNQIHWFCKEWGEKAITSFKFIQDVQKDVQNLGTAIAKLNQNNDEVLSRLNKLEENDRVNIGTGPGDNKVTEIERIIGRIETKKDNTKRPLKIQVKCISEKYEILRKSPSQTEVYHSTYISPDLMNEQQKNGKLLRDEMKLRANNGESNLWIQRGKTSPRCLPQFTTGHRGQLNTHYHQTTYP